ncbi:MAG TPA: response regulator [Bacillota bacterium]|nr:response regulator [Bacillota bacterium]
MNEPLAHSSALRTGDKPLIYIVDDEAMLLELASVILEPLGYDLKTFCDPADALAAFRAAPTRPALLITDFAMHTMTGTELIEACRRVHPSQKTLLVSGTVGPEICQHASSKPDYFLAKPYHAKQLINLVESILAV